MRVAVAPPAGTGTESTGTERSAMRFAHTWAEAGAECWALITQWAHGGLGSMRLDESHGSVSGAGFDSRGGWGSERLDEAPSVQRAGRRARAAAAVPVLSQRKAELFRFTGTGTSAILV